MRLTDIFEGTVPVATVWRKRGDTIQRGRMSKFIPNPQALKKIEVNSHEKGEEDSSS